MSALARAASDHANENIHTSTISSMIFGERETSRVVIGAVAKALGVDVRQVEDWVGNARQVAKPFRPHADADLLDADERRAVNELIRLMALPKRGGGARERSAAPIDTGEVVLEMVPTPRADVAHSDTTTEVQLALAMAEVAAQYLQRAGGDWDVAAALLQHDGDLDEPKRAGAYALLNRDAQDEGITSVAAYRGDHPNE